MRSHDGITGHSPYRVLQTWSNPAGPMELSPRPRPCPFQDYHHGLQRSQTPSTVPEPPYTSILMQTVNDDINLPIGASDMSTYWIMWLVGSSPNIRPYVPYLLLHSHWLQRKRPVRVHHRRPSWDLGVRLGCSMVKRRPPNGRLSGPASAAQASLALLDGWQRVEQPEPLGFQPLRDCSP